MRKGARQWLNQKGQTSVEYMLLVAMAVGLCLTVSKKLDEYLVKNPNSLINVQLNKYKRSFGLSSDPNFRFKTISVPH